MNNATSNRNDTGSYRIPIAVQLAWSLILFFGLLFLPETPRYLIKKDNAEKAAQSLSRLRRLPIDHEAIAAELAEVRATHNFEMTMGQGSYMDCLRPPILRRQLTGMGLQALQQLTGKFEPSPTIVFSLDSKKKTELSLQASTLSFTTGPSISKTLASPAASSSP